MFDVGFAEVGLVLIVALFVLGPKRLPQVAKTCGKYLAYWRRAWGKVKQEAEALLPEDQALDERKSSDLSKKQRSE